MLRCREVVELLATDGWRDARLSRRLSLHLHLMMCRHCRAYRRALRRLGDVARTLYQAATDDAEELKRLVATVRRAAERRNAG
jgi:sigma54-dependent transcription regulator